MIRKIEGILMFLFGGIKVLLSLPIMLCCCLITIVKIYVNGLSMDQGIQTISNNLTGKDLNEVSVQTLLESIEKQDNSSAKWKSKMLMFFTNSLLDILCGYLMIVGLTDSEIEQCLNSVLTEV